MSERQIYALLDPRDGDIRYIGASASPLTRVSEHVVHARMTRRPGKVAGRRDIWLRQLDDDGLFPGLQILEQPTTEWQVKERNWIALGIELEWPLTNSKIGSNADYSPSQKQRVDLGTRSSKRRKGVSLSLETRERIAAGVRRAYEVGLLPRAKSEQQKERTRESVRQSWKTRGRPRQRRVTCSACGMTCGVGPMGNHLRANPSHA